jgi:hypothetical protein
MDGRMGHGFSSVRKDIEYVRETLFIPFKVQVKDRRKR